LGVQTKKQQLMKRMSTDLLTTLVESQAFVKSNQTEGCVCPTCGQNSKIWRKKMISTAAASLIRLVSMYDGHTPIHFDKFTVLAKDRNFSQLTLWDLITPSLETNMKHKSSGKWAPTEKGIRFVNRRIRIQPYSVTYNNELLMLTGEPASIDEILNKRFDYDELMAKNSIS